ncbi:hypothetical protein [Blattabacterium cuenoti]|uniref:hypothetical protein n=1 Tax=Blattabacterium cuenoti TaxID=1653831 RepID=UPI00163C23F7|nr:hypothetical protein [Blattabacterium cuenoti]
MNKNHFFSIMLTKKYQPIKWDDVVGQKDIIIILKKVIKKNYLSQISFFLGPKGVGKNTCAKIFAKELNHFSSSIAEENDFFNIFEINGLLTTTKEDLFRIINKLRLYPKKGKYNICIVNDIYSFSTEFFNIIIKIIKNPPLHILFIICLQEKNKILDSIITCGKIYDFQPISLKKIYLYLKYIVKKEGIKIDNEALFFISKYVNGSIMEALSILDKFTLYEQTIISKKLIMNKLGVLDNNYYFQIVDDLFNHKISKILILIDKIFKKGINYLIFIKSLTQHFRNLLLAKDPETIFSLKFKKNIIESYIQQAKKISIFFLIKSLKICCCMENEFKYNKFSSRLIIEIYLIQLSNNIYLYHLNNYDKSKNKKIQFLKENWKNFIDKFSKKINPIYLKLLINEIQFHIDTNKIFFIIPSQLENNEFFLIQTYFRKFLKKKLNNINLEFKIITKGLENSPIKKYNLLSNKNKFVDKLIEKLHLKMSS